MDRAIYPRFGGWIEQSVVFYRSPLEKEPAPGAEAFSGAESTESIHVLVDKSIAIDDRRSPENLEVER